MIASEHDSRQGRKEEAKPNFRVLERLNELVPLPCLVLYTRLVDLNAPNSQNALLGGEEPSGRWGIGEEEPKYD